MESSVGMNRKIVGVKAFNENSFVFGTSGEGRGFHPWDYLKGRKCPNCSRTEMLMVGKDFQKCESGFPYYIKCRACGFLIAKSSFDSYEVE